MSKLLERMELSIVIPAKNEAKRLPATLHAINDYMQHSSRSVEVIVVDDGSTDDTAQVAKSIMPNVRLITHEKNMGKGAAVRTGMIAAEGEWRYLCDADLSTPISELDHLLTYANRADVIIGSRNVPGSTVTRHQSWWKEVLGHGGNIVIQLLLLPGIHDSQCGFKLFNARTVKIFHLQRQERWGYDFEVLFLARKLGWRIAEVPVQWVNDPRSTVKPLDYIKTLTELFTIRMNAWMGRYTTS